MAARRPIVVFAVAGIVLSGFSARARPAADDFLNPQPPGARWTLMPFAGPGFRAIYDHRFELEEDVTELRTQAMGTVAIPFAEASANLDLRLFLVTAGASAGYHGEWRVLRFEPDPATGRDRAGAPEVALPPGADPTPHFSDLTREARRAKDQNTDFDEQAWPFYELRWGFLWPAHGFMGVSIFAGRYDGRPDVSYDWEHATVLNGGWHLRWEGYALFRERNTGFAGPAARVLYVPRNRVPRAFTIPSSGMEVAGGSACQADNPHIPCVETYEAEIHYGILAGRRPNLTDSPDLLLVRVYATFGLKNELFGTHVFGAPLQLLVAYMVTIE